MFSLLAGKTKQEFCVERRGISDINDSKPLMLLLLKKNLRRRENESNDERALNINEALILHLIFLVTV